MVELNHEKSTPVVRFDRLSSTSDYAKTLPLDGQDRWIVATCQDKGRGREGRSFSSQEGGVYLSWVHYPDQLLARDSFLLVVKAAVAVCKTLEDYGLKPEIKWPNDVLVGGKKICGILTENLLQGDRIKRAIIGIGLNVNNDLEADLRPIATTLFQSTGKRIPVAEVEESLMNNLLAPVAKEAYFARLGHLGEVEIIEGERRYAAIAEGVDESGLLVITVDGRRQKKSAVEISLRRKEKV
ncbi:MAG: biotin--[Clostridia bacterium]|nr:biotin--[acetyl-CoA-carboxylase] ligase [Clostridia bacterium]